MPIATRITAEIRAHFSLKIDFPATNKPNNKQNIPTEIIAVLIILPSFDLIGRAAATNMVIINEIIPIIETKPRRPANNEWKISVIKIDPINDIPSQYTDGYIPMIKYAAFLTGNGTIFFI